MLERLAAEESITLSAAVIDTQPQEGVRPRLRRELLASTPH